MRTEHTDVTPPELAFALLVELVSEGSDGVAMHPDHLKLVPVLLDHVRALEAEVLRLRAVVAGAAAVASTAAPEAEEDPLAATRRELDALTG